MIISLQAITLQNTNHAQALPIIFSLYVWNKIRKKDGATYGNKFYQNKLTYHQKWIETDPGRAATRLRNTGLCSYCSIILTRDNRSEDHIVGRDLDVVQFMVPCCKICNSSKGKKDLLDWWCNHKGKNILELKQDILSIYVRAKYRILKIQNRLSENIPDIYNEIIKQMELPIDVK